MHPLSTSNHNGILQVSKFTLLYCILFLHQTTTSKLNGRLCRVLYCILFLHQTTTPTNKPPSNFCCIASSFYIKPQHGPSITGSTPGCIASSFYIKPQRIEALYVAGRVVLHPLSTSNHNFHRRPNIVPQLYCILFLHQTTTSDARHFDFRALNSQ